MAQWRESTDAEIVDLASRLQSVDWSWRIADVPELAAAFGWQVLTAHPNSVTLDNGFGMDSGEVIGRDGRAESIELALTSVASNDVDGRAQARDALARMAAVLTGALGEPTSRKPGRSPEIRWVGAEATLRLVGLSRSVQLCLTANSYLAKEDQAIELEERGLV
ncbi:DUF6301 family protein [Nocardia sp. NBC_00881]|uniref:DUF6301 family protein n=1 Tax=Nocardia sp. NBC_00881 TaxID=2975995 RepID=UPI00386342D5|nr:DUF6301 family protein [Nocardia sp. NBC_00881]